MPCVLTAQPQLFSLFVTHWGQAISSFAALSGSLMSVNSALVVCVIVAAARRRQPIRRVGVGRRRAMAKAISRDEVACLVSCIGQRWTRPLAAPPSGSGANSPGGMTVLLCRAYRQRQSFLTFLD